MRFCVVERRPKDLGIPAAPADEVGGLGIGPREGVSLPAHRPEQTLASAACSVPVFVLTKPAPLIVERDSCLTPFKRKRNRINECSVQSPAVPT